MRLRPCERVAACAMTIAAGLAFALPTPAQAQRESEQFTSGGRPGVNRLCLYLASKARDDTPGSPFSHVYQRIIYHAAGVSDDEYENGTDEEIGRKVSALWEREILHLRCGPMGVPATGDPLRYAMHIVFNDFIADALSLWQIDLNHVDKVIGTQTFIGTYLDDLDHKVSITSGVTKRNYEAWRNSFIASGAKRASELSGN